MTDTTTAAASPAGAATPAPNSASGATGTQSVTVLAPQPQAPVAPPAASALDSWFDQHIRNSVFSTDTALHNRLHALVQDIKSLIHQKAGV